MSDRLRQAVVIIHGIGEQRPMATLRGFVASVLSGDCSHEGVNYWSKPDQMSESFELRRMTAASSSTRPITDFFEYYWAYNVRDSKYRHVVQWLFKLLFRSPRQIPGKIKGIWLLIWILLLAFVVLAAMGLLPASKDVLGEKTLMTSLVSVGVLSVLNVIMLGYIGDAARYLNASPENITLRQTIRAEGLQLLRKLHQSKKYDRIVIVGHSLGSVIGYDMIKHYWAECNDVHASPLVVDQSALKAAEYASVALQKPDADTAKNPASCLQQELWLEQRKLGNPWLVTDFITLGSPLVHGQLLLAEDKEEFQNRKTQREMLTCPPELENHVFSYPLLPPYEVQGQKRSIRALHHAAAFGCTRWTNLYFPGDLIGGPLKSVFGQWINDVRVEVKTWRLRSYSPRSHLWYWCARPKQLLRAHFKEQFAIGELKKALELDSVGWLPPR